MAGEASTIPLRDGHHGGRSEQRSGLGALRDRAPASSGRLGGAICLSAIVACSLFIVVIAADRPSALVPATHSGFYPGWMAARSAGCGRA